MDHDENDAAERQAYKEKLRSLGFGYAYGKAEFHGPTIRERCAKQEADAAAVGRTIEPVGKRWI